MASLLVLQGHSSESISDILGIATGTVRIHRKNVYAKMRISSQRELFAMFIGSGGKLGLARTKE